MACTYMYAQKNHVERKSGFKSNFMHSTVVSSPSLSLQVTLKLQESEVEHVLQDQPLLSSVLQQNIWQSIVHSTTHYLFISSHCHCFYSPTLCIQQDIALYMYTLYISNPHFIILSQYPHSQYHSRLSPCMHAVGSKVKHIHDIVCVCWESLGTRLHSWYIDWRLRI